jgi:DNA invertase Pin-like site-specific DNA recombinase
MAAGTFIAYYRVSTDRQGRSGLGLDAQRHAVEQYLNGGDGKLAKEYVEVESGKRADRPQLIAALAQAKRIGATLVIAKLDRLARNVAFVANLMEAGVDFVAVDMPHASRLTIHILAAVAEHEREMISARTRAALQAAKARGVKLGGPSSPEQYERSAETRRRRAQQFAQNALPIISQIQHAGVTTYAGIAAALNVRGVRPSRGTSWHANTVRRVLMQETL